MKSFFFCFLFYCRCKKKIWLLQYSPMCFRVVITYSIWDSTNADLESFVNKYRGFANNTNVIHNLIPHPNGVKLWAIKASAIYTHLYNSFESESVTYTTTYWLFHILALVKAPRHGYRKRLSGALESLKPSTHPLSFSLFLSISLSPFSRFPNHSLYFAIPSGANDDSLLF